MTPPTMMITATPPTAIPSTSTLCMATTRTPAPRTEVMVKVSTYLSLFFLPTPNFPPPSILPALTPITRFRSLLAEWPCAPSYSSAKVFSTAQLGSKWTTLTLQFLLRQRGLGRRQYPTSMKRKGRGKSCGAESGRPPSTLCLPRS